MVSKLDIFYLPTRYVMCTIFAALLGLTCSSFLKLKIQELSLTFPPNIVMTGKEEGLCGVARDVGFGDAQTKVYRLALVLSHHVILLRSPLPEPDYPHL